MKSIEKDLAMSKTKSVAREITDRTLASDSYLAYAFRKINEMDTEKEDGPAPAPPAARKQPQVIRERKQPQLIKEEPIPQPASIKPDPVEINPPAHPAPAAAKPTVDPRLVEVAKLWTALSERDRQELLLIARMKARLK
jgi:hypothetical protein